MTKRENEKDKLRGIWCELMKAEISNCMKKNPKSCPFYSQCIFVKN